MKQCDITRADVLDGLDMAEVGEWMELNTRKIILDQLNWPHIAPYQPLASVAVNYTGSHLYLHFFVHSLDLRAENTANLSPVADDSCVEFFMQLPTSDQYWNFEFNCIGTVNASHRVERPKAVRLTDEQIAGIRRHASCGASPFSEKKGVHDWSLTVAIPFALIGVADGQLPALIRANFYNCAGKTAHPHYLSWNPINLEKPNFHAPQFFGQLNFV